MPAIFKAFAEWRDRWRDKSESFEFFADGTGGFGVVNVADENELQQLIMEYPFALFDDIESHVIVDGDASLQQWIAAAEQMAAQFGSQ
jgi:hypothetical protein